MIIATSPIGSRSVMKCLLAEYAVKLFHCKENFMRKIYEFMHSRQIGLDTVSQWSINNRSTEVDKIHDLIDTSPWTTEMAVQYNQEFVDNTVQHHGIDADTVVQWLNDPEFECYRNLTFSARVLSSDPSPLRTLIRDMFGFDDHKLRIRYQNQRPGKMVPLHLDGYKHLYYGLPPEQEHLVRRYVIFLEDQRPGQVWLVNDDFVHWHRGDVLTWSHCITPHGTANFGYNDRPILVVTGFLKRP